MSTRQSIFNIRLVRELTAFLVLKLLIISAIAVFFFSDPVELANPDSGIESHFGLEPASSLPLTSEDIQHD